MLIHPMVERLRGLGLSTMADFEGQFGRGHRIDVPAGINL
jgi:hypothetical protein